MSYLVSRKSVKFTVIASMVLTGCSISGPPDSVFNPLKPHSTKKCKSIPVFVRHSEEHAVEISNKNGRCVVSVDGATEKDEKSQCGNGAILYRQSGTEVDIVSIGRSCTFMVEMGNYGIRG